MNFPRFTWLHLLSVESPAYHHCHLLTSASFYHHRLSWPPQVKSWLENDSTYLLLQELLQLYHQGLEVRDPPPTSGLKGSVMQGIIDYDFPRSYLGGRGASCHTQNCRGCQLIWQTLTMTDERQHGGKEPTDIFFFSSSDCWWFFQTSYSEIEMFKQLIAFSCKTLGNSVMYSFIFPIRLSLPVDCSRWKTAVTFLLFFPLRSRV